MTMTLPAWARSKECRDTFMHFTDEPHAREYRCNLGKGHDGDHQYRRGSWPLVVWPQTDNSQ